MVIKSSLLAVALLAVTPFAQAAKFDIVWKDPAKYIDFRSSDINQDKFRQQVMKTLEEQFRKEAGKLPADQSLHVEIKDLDMAGRLEYFVPGYTAGLRVISGQIDFPSMELAYVLRDAKGEVVKSGESQFSDMGFRDGIVLPLDNSDLKYEKQMIVHWYQKSF